MVRLAPLFLLLLPACEGGSPNQGTSSVTVKLPPPKAAPAPGFSAPVTAELG